MLESSVKTLESRSYSIDTILHSSGDMSRPPDILLARALEAIADVELLATDNSIIGAGNMSASLGCLTLRKKIFLFAVSKVKVQTFMLNCWLIWELLDCSQDENDSE